MNEFPTLENRDLPEDRERRAKVLLRFLAVEKY